MHVFLNAPAFVWHVCHILPFLYCNKINSLPVSINKSDSLGLHCLINQLCVLVFCAVQYCHKFALPPVHKCIHFKNFQL